jgi:hypothetical protein
MRGYRPENRKKSGQPRALAAPERCRCGTLHLEIPAQARCLNSEDEPTSPWLRGFYWECDYCYATLFVSEQALHVQFEQSSYD